jgi:predicted DNA-binding helix-hairpin-helix protein
MEFFPLEVNRAGYDELLRVPGMGVKSILKILNARRYGKIMPDDLKKFGVVLKRARFFITCNGRKISDLCTDPFIIRAFLMSKAENKPKKLKLPFLYEVGT